MISKKITPVYEASAIIQVNDVSTADNSSIFNNQAAAVSYALQIPNNRVFQQASKELSGVSPDVLAASVSATPLDNTQLIQVQADAHSSQLAADIANTVASVFIQQQVATVSTINRTAAATLAKELVTAKTDVDNAQAELTKLQNSPASESQIAHQTDILNGYQLNYNTLFASYSQIQLRENLIDNSLTIAQSAVPPVKAKSPNILLNSALAAALSLLLTIAVIFLFDWFDTTIKTSEDVAQLASLEPLGSIPYKSRSKDKVLFHDAAIAEAFVTISINFRMLVREYRSILVTGLHTDVGTSQAASGLAHALAQSGLRVMVVDANLSRPRQHMTFNGLSPKKIMDSLDEFDRLPRQPSFVQPWLTQWSTDTPNLYLLPAGPQLDNREPIQLAMRLRAFTDTLLQQSTSFSEESDEIDIIIFDAPALDQGADTIALAPVTDCTVLVVEAGKERPEALQRVQATLQRLGSPIIGVVVNRQKARHRTYFYANQPHQAAFPTERSQTSFVPKYPPLRTRTLSFQKRAEAAQHTPFPQAKEASSDDTVIVPRMVPVPDTPILKRMKKPTMPLVAVESSAEPSKANGFWSGDNQG